MTISADLFDSAVNKKGYIMKNMKLGTRLGIGFLVAIILLVIVGVMGLSSLKTTNQGLETVYNDRVVPLKGLKIIADAYAVNVIDAVNKTNAGQMKAEDALNGIQAASRQISKEWNAYMATTLTAEEAKLANEAEKLFQPANRDIQRLESALKAKSGNIQGQLAEFDGPLYSTIDPIGGKITDLIELQLRVSKEVYDSAVAQYNDSLYLTIGLIVAAIVVSMLVGLAITRNVMRQIGGEPDYAAQIVRQMSEGDLSIQVQIRPGDTNSLLAAMQNMVGKLSQIIGEVRGAADSLSSASEEVSATAQSAFARVRASRRPAWKKPVRRWSR